MSQINGTQPIERCKTCGSCCKTMGCHYSPDDFKEINYEYLKSEIEKGHISIDWWEDNPNRYFLRIRNVDADAVDPSWGGRCSLLTENGCPLPFEKRPKGARFLDAKQSGDCDQGYGKKACADDWYAYDEILVKLVDYFR